MAHNVHVAAATRNKALNAALETDSNSGVLYIYTGPQPANASVAVTTQTELAILTMGATAFGGASAGVATANAITGALADASGTAVWFRLYKSDATTVILDGSVGTSSADLVLDNVVITSGQLVSVSSLTVTLAA